VLYLHIILQFLRYPKEFSGPGIPGDPFGRSFIERVSRMNEKTRRSRLKKIESALRIAVPQLKQLTHVIDTEEGGVPHLEVLYEHWRMRGAKQREDQFSDGTLRLIGLLWSLLESDSLLLLEEPELSLNTAIVKKLPALIYRLQKQKN
jgi:predicted ATPase